MTPVYDVCVIGAGPAGIAITVQLARLGWKVVLVESGDEGTNRQAAELADAFIDTPDSHCTMSEGIRRGLGGTSALWGGRCVPFDPVDFEEREYVDHSGWPITHEDLQPFMQSACSFLGVGQARFRIADCPDFLQQRRPLSDKFVDADGVLGSQLERWSVDPNVWKRNRSHILLEPGISVLSGFTCVGFMQPKLEESVLAALLSRTTGNGAVRESISAKVFVLACGGIETTRLVLNSLLSPDGIKLAGEKLVGRFYMGHPSGKIADIEFDGKPTRTLYGFERDEGIYIRRRLTFEAEMLKRERLLNIAFWPDNPLLSDAQHGSGVLSAAYLALSSPIGRWLAPAGIRNRIAEARGALIYEHLRNCIRNPLATIGFCAKFFYQRYVARPRLPGFFTYSPLNRYALHYHSEQVPDWNNRIELSEHRDALGMRRARITLRWCEQDIDSIIRAHYLLDARLKQLTIGRLIWRVGADSVINSVRQQAIDGFHQLGTLRMGRSSDCAVTDAYGQFFGTPNAFAASSAVFPTSGQANPTLTLVAFSLRQATRIDALLRN